MKKQHFAYIDAAWQPLFRAFVLRVMQAAHPLFGRSDGHPVYEGNQLAVTHNSDIGVADFQRVAGYFDLPHEVIYTTNISAFITALLAGALSMSNSQQQVFVKQLNEILEKTGRSFDNEEQPLTWDRLLGFLDQLEFSFDEDGHCQPLTLLVPPTLTSVAQRILTESRTDLQKQQQLNALVERKREAHNDREAHRELAD